VNVVRASPASDTGLVANVSLLTLFVAATTWLPGRALSLLPREWRPPRSALLESACGLGLSLAICSFSPAWAGSLLGGLVAASGIAWWLGRHRSRASSLDGLAGGLAGAVIAMVVLSVGPWGDVSWSSDGELSYRTGGRVGERSAGPSGVLTEAALVESRRHAASSGDPFVSGFPLPTLDARRNYLSLARSFSGWAPFGLFGKVFPTLWIGASIWAGAILLRSFGRLAPLLFGSFLFGSGLSWLAAAIPLVQSWRFRIWLYLTGSTGLPALLEANGTSLLLFLLLASVACLCPDADGSPSPRAAAWLAASVALCEPDLLPAIAAAGCLYFASKKSLAPALALAGAGLSVLLTLRPLAFSPLQPLVRALDYARLETMREIVLDALSGGDPEDVLRTALYVPAFVVLSLGVRAAMIPGLFRSFLRPDLPSELWGAALSVSLLALGLIFDAAKYWSLALLLLWLFVARWLAARIEPLPVARKAFALGLAAVLAFPSSVDFFRHYRSSPRERTAASDIELGRRLAALAAPGEPVLHRPNRGRLSLASHVAVRPAVLCYFGRSDAFASTDLSERSEDIRIFFATANTAEAMSILARYRVRWILVERDRPLGFLAPERMALVDESENHLLYELRPGAPNESP